jgi:hypothetical protein
MPGSRHPRLIALILLLATVAVCAGVMTWAWYCRPVICLGPMVQQVTPTGFTVYCRTHACSRVSARLHAEGVVSREGSVRRDEATGDAFATFDGLEPGQACEYEIVLNGTRSTGRHAMRTAPTDSRGFRFVAFGDSGTGDFHQYAVADRMRACRPDLLCHVGDLIYPRGRPEDHPRKFFQPYAELLAAAPLYLSLGNHEYRMPGVDPVPASFILPANGPAGTSPGRNYWFDYGDARFAAIDSNDDEPFFRDTIAPWLDALLQSAGDKWTFVLFHEPVHTQSKYPPARKLLTTIVPILERHGVALVMSGHNHLYERSQPIRDGHPVTDGYGTVYITTGAGGANLAEVVLPMPETIAAWNDQEHSFTLVDVSADRLDVRQVSESGRTIDEFHRPRPANRQ